MPHVDTFSALIGIVLTAVPSLIVIACLVLRLNRAATRTTLLEERLCQSQLAEEGLSARLENTQQALQAVTAQEQQLSMREAVLQRELEMTRAEHDAALAEEQRQQQALDEQALQVRQLLTENSALQTELREQREHHQQRLQDLQRARDEMKAQFAELATRIFEEREQRFAQNSQQRLGQLLDPLRERLQTFEKRVEESYQHEARERFSLMKELARLQQLNLRLSEEADNLTQALKGQKVQGCWGELVLEKVLEQSGLVNGREYVTQASLTGADGHRFQPDVLIRLPGDRQVVVDAKVSLNAYQQFISAEDEDSRRQAAKRHAQALRTHVKGLSDKDYKRLDELHTLDFVLLFVPIESAFSLALQDDPGLFQEAFSRDIVIVSPTTLLATLRLIESLWRQQRQNLNAREIAEKAGALYDKLVSFVQDLDEIGQRLQQTEKAYQNARNKLRDGRGNLISRSEQIRQLGARVSKRLPEQWLEAAGEEVETADA